ncbi:MAG: NAD(P)H-dependent oxidoreductase [Firmicutes bacterium]|nr:NAD(P)H-dependent oxidoreductase [Bacillota bacterium]
MNQRRLSQKITLIRPLCPDSEKTLRLSDVLDFGLRGLDCEVLETVSQIQAADLHDRRILFAIELGESGINLEYVRMLKLIRLNREMFRGCVAGIIVDGASELYTKSVSRHLEFSANRAGCAFLGRPLVEGTLSLRNYNVVANILGTDNLNAYRQSVKDLADRLLSFRPKGAERPHILALHAGHSKQSNTLMLWDMIRTGIEDQADILEISLHEGEIYDCRGCKFETCLHMGEESRCIYGGVITEEVYPAILDCDALVMICPNYNDAISANLTAFVNRLTALFRVHRFYDKQLYAVIVSGYSGSDIVAEQLISSLNMNKSFLLPPEFAMIRTANDRGSIARREHIREDALAFGQRMIAQLREGM